MDEEGGGVGGRMQRRRTRGGGEAGACRCCTAVRRNKRGKAGGRRRSGEGIRRRGLVGPHRVIVTMRRDAWHALEPEDARDAILRGYRSVFLKKEAGSFRSTRTKCDCLVDGKA